MPTVTHTTLRGSAMALPKEGIRYWMSSAMAGSSRGRPRFFLGDSYGSPVGGRGDGRGYAYGSFRLDHGPAGGFGWGNGGAYGHHYDTTLRRGYGYGYGSRFL